MTESRRRPTPEEMTARCQGFLPGRFGVVVTVIEPGRLTSTMTVLPEFLAPNGFLHAAAVVALADTACGIACLCELPAGATSFTTVELKTNFLGTVRTGVLTCIAEARHLGRTTQLWDAEVLAQDSGRRLALFRCTQMILWPAPGGGGSAG
ncbi:MAG: hotdog fold thioesterase [Azospirillum sp.]|nr:hotdog fold thioesterase [Azospirillum sp.]